MPRKRMIVPGNEGAADECVTKVLDIDNEIQNEIHEALDDLAERRRDLVARRRKLLKRRDELTAKLHHYYRTNRSKKSEKRFIDLPSGRIGERVCPRVEVPKRSFRKVPKEALSVRTRVNKRVLAALGPKAMKRAGAKIVKPSKFYVKPRR